MPAKLSVNINYALLRNSRGGAAPDLREVIDTCVAAGAPGITVHPRRDQRHIRFEDVPEIASHLRANHPGIELNVECEDHPLLIELVRRVKPEQCTLVPVTPGEITSDHGWDLPTSIERLKRVIGTIAAEGVRTSCFADCVPDRIRLFRQTGTDRVELYTGPYAWAWGSRTQQREQDLVHASARAAAEAGIGVNAGHDLDRHNLAGMVGIPNLFEVSIGHAQICRALEVGTAQSIKELLAALGG